jgi:zinc/manganese transport system substrate-binding protein
MLKTILIVTAVLTIVAAILGCQPAAATTAGKKSIVTTYSILGSMVKELVGDKARVVVSIPNGLDPHEWEPSAKDIEAINKADLVVRNGLGLESGLERALEASQNKGVRVFTAADYITIRYVSSGEGIPADDPDRAVGAADPHLWMDPLALRSIVRALAEELKKDFHLDVASQASNLVMQLDNLNKQAADIIDTIPQGDRKLVTGHESMGYFAQRYNLKLVGVIIPSLSTQAVVSASDLAALKKAIIDNRVKAIFTELGTSPSMAKAIGDETGVRVVELSTHTLPDDGSYFTFLKGLAGVIAGALK